MERPIVEGHTESCVGDQFEAGETWAEVIYRNLKERNRTQVEPFASIYQSNTKLWYEHNRLQSLLKDVKHQFATVQHETAELFTLPGTEISASKVDKLKVGLAQIQTELREKGNLGSNERRVKIDLSKKVRDQLKLIADQSEELKMAKGELSSTHEMLSLVSEEIRVEKNSGKTVKEELENIRNLFRKLEAENSQLIERILIEKGKTAQAMNDMMNRAEGPHKKDGRVSEKIIHSDSMPTEASEFLRRSNIEKVEPLRMKSIRVLQCHTSEINDLAVSSNGGYFVTAGSDYTIKTVEMSTGRNLLSLKGSSPIICVDISRSQNRGDMWVVGGSSDGSFRLWNMETGALRLQLMGHASRIHSCHILGDGSHQMVSCSADRCIKLWDISRTTADAVSTLKSASSVLSVVSSPDQSTLTSGHQDGALRFWDYVRSPQCIHTVNRLHTGHITHVQYSPRNSFEILTMGRDNTLSILDSRNYTSVQTFQAPSFRVTYDWSRASISPDGRYLSAGSTDGGVYIWNVSAGCAQPQLPCLVLKSPDPASPVSAVNWCSPQGELVSAGKGGVCTIWK